MEGVLRRIENHRCREIEMPVNHRAMLIEFRMHPLEVRLDARLRSRRIAARHSTPCTAAHHCTPGAATHHCTPLMTCTAPFMRLAQAQSRMSRSASIIVWYPDSAGAATRLGLPGVPIC